MTPKELEDTRYKLSCYHGSYGRLFDEINNKVCNVHGDTFFGIYKNVKRKTIDRVDSVTEVILFEIKYIS